MNGGFFKWFIFITHQTHFHSNVLTKNVLLVLSIYISLYSYKIILFVDNYTVDEVITTELDGKLFHKFHKCAENIDVIFLLRFHHLIEQEKNNMYFLRNYDLQEI